MARWIELLESNSTSADGDLSLPGNTGQSVRVFHVENVIAQQIVNQPSSVQDDASGQSLPDYRSEHPSNSALRLDRYDVAPRGTYFLATAVYSSNGSGRLAPRPPDRTDPNYPDFSATFQSQTDSLPINVPAQVQVANENGVVTTVNGRAVIEQAVELRIQRVTVRRVIPVSLINTTMRALERQSGKLHLLTPFWSDAGLWKFEGADVNVLEAGLYEVRYSWASDPGIPDINTDAMANADVFAPVVVDPLPQYPGLWSRPPWHSVVWLQIPGQTDQIVEVATLNHTIDETGYQELPEL